MTEGGIFESPLHVFKPPECMTVRSHHSAQLLWKTIIHGRVRRTVVRKYSPELCLPVWLQSWKETWDCSCFPQRTVSCPNFAFCFLKVFETLEYRVVSSVWFMLFKACVCELLQGFMHLFVGSCWGSFSLWQPAVFLMASRGRVLWSQKDFWLYENKMELLLCEQDLRVFHQSLHLLPVCLCSDSSAS